LLFPVWVQGQALPVLRLATLEWPPYNSSLLPAGGINTALVYKAFEIAGYKLQVVTLPWTQAVNKGLHDPAYDGYFPEYSSPTVRRNCYLSASAGQSPVVFARLHSSSAQLKEARDARHYLVGVVNGYNNSEQFDADVLSGKQRVSRVDSDETNLRQLVRGKVDLIVIDKNVMQWLIPHSPALRPFAHAVEVISPPLQIQNLYLCFKRTPHGQALSDAFARGLSGIDVPAFALDYLSALPAN
jgi:polar amino acid transport system substrate-binding protein